MKQARSSPRDTVALTCSRKTCRRGLAALSQRPYLDQFILSPLPPAPLAGRGDTPDRTKRPKSGSAALDLEVGPRKPPAAGFRYLELNRPGKQPLTEELPCAPEPGSPQTQDVKGPDGPSISAFQSARGPSLPR